MSKLLDIDEVVKKIRVYQEDNGFSSGQLRLELIDKKFIKMIGDKDKAHKLLLCVSKEDKSYIEFLCEIMPVFSAKRDAFTDTRPSGYKELVEGLLGALSKPTAKDNTGDKTYIYALKDKGYRLVSSKEEIGYVTGVPSLVMELIQKTYTPSPINGYYDSSVLKLRSVLESVGLDPKAVNLWDKSVYSKHEDLAFRLFVKETASSYDFLLKIPKGMNSTAFNLSANGIPSKHLESLPGCFADDGSYTKAPAMAALSSSFGVDSPYLLVRLNIVKDYIAFKKENWLLRDYIKTAKGKETSKYSELGALPLGNSLMVGVYPGGYLDWEINCEQGVSACLMSGGAGSGKTVMFDSILLQSLAYEGDYGDGAVVLLDFKQEWVASWKKYFSDRGIPFYGFDGEPLPTQSLKYEHIDNKGNKQIRELPYVMPNYLAGALFLNGMYNYIQKLMKYDKDNPSTNIYDYNTSSKTSEGISRIPRLTILSDEINSMSDRISKRKEYMAIYKNCMLQAKATRTSGYIWFFAGQDISHSIIPKAEKNNYLYRIGGSLPTARYIYHELTPNPSIKAYAELHGTEKIPDPIMRQGMFYAGQAEGISTVTKCMFLPSDERGEALDDLDSKIPGMHQFHAIVKLALEDGIFDTAPVESLGYKTNAIYCALWQLGILTEHEFNHYTNRCFGDLENDSDNGDDDNDDEFIYSDEDIEKDVSEAGAFAMSISEEGLDIVDNIGVQEVVTSPESINVLKSQQYSDNVADYYDNIGVGSVEDATTYVDDIEDYDNLIVDNDVGSQKSGSYMDAEGGIDNILKFPAKLSKYDSGGYTHDSTAPKIETMWVSPKTEEIPKDDPVYTESVKSPNTFMGCAVYKDELDLGNMNPFDASASKTIFGGIDAFKYMNKVIEKELKRAFHGLDRINTVHVSDNGLFVNDIAFRPFVPKVVIDSLPVDIQGEVSRGNIIEFVDFGVLSRMPNLDTVIVDDTRLAETRIRRELKMRKDTKWGDLYYKYPSLHLIVIGGSKISNVEEEEEYEETTKGDYEFRERVRKAFEFDEDILDRVKSPVRKLWKSKPVAIITGALGGTVGANIVLGVASMMGAWGILFAGLAGYGAYNTYIRGNSRSSNRNNTSTGNGGYDMGDYDGYDDIRDNNRNSGRQSKNAKKRR